MSSKSMRTLVIVCLMTSAQLCPLMTGTENDTSENDAALRVYLPREVTIKDDTITLGKVGILRGQEALVAKASNVTLGRLSLPGQEIVIDRSNVLSRLACTGVPPSKVTLMGADKITISQQQQTVTGAELTELAGSFLKKSPLHRSVIQLTAISTPKDLILPGPTKNVTLSPGLLKSSSLNYARVRIAVLADGKEIGARNVTFRLKHNCRRAVALTEIKAGEVIGPNDIKIEKAVSDYPEPENWSPPYGLVARRNLPPNTVISPDMVATARPVKVIERNQTVVIRIERPGLLVMSLGKAMQDAHTGQYIRVRNLDSQRIILGRVKDDGTVEPVL